jgi:hypothetical protein
VPELVARAHVQVDCERWLEVETTTDLVGCDGWGTRAVGHGRRRTTAWAADGGSAGGGVGRAPLALPDPDCAVVTWSEDIDEIAPRAVLTGRTRHETLGHRGRTETDNTHGVRVNHYR